jgi:hypothetical protein
MRFIGKRIQPYSVKLFSSVDSKLAKEIKFNKIKEVDLEEENYFDVISKLVR